MSFREQTLGGLLDARTAASEILRDEGVVEPHILQITIHEAIVMQAVSDVLKDRHAFWGHLVARQIGDPRTLNIKVSKILTKFEGQYHLTTLLDDGIPKPYQATELGRTVFGLFSPPTEQPDHE